MNSDSRQCILLFLRAPEKGRVKTRLAAALGDDVTLRLYRAFVLDILDMLFRTEYPVVLCFHPREKASEIKAWLGRELPCWPQTGKTLGKKMANAFIRAFSEGFDRVVLVGSDIPDLPDRIIESAFSAINREGAAIGPAEDGGYYLVAFRKSVFLPGVFENIPWGTEKVLQQTLKVFNAHRAPVSLLEPWRDMDDAGDVKDLLAKHPSDDAPAPRTLALLRTAGFEGARGQGAKGNNENSA